MTPEDLARTKAHRLTDARARTDAEFAASVLGILMRQRGGVVSRAELMEAGLNRRRRRLRRRSFVETLLSDIPGGAHPVLEHAYLTRVERAHGLPASRRQVSRPTPGGKEYRDVEYPDHDPVVELDGRLGHDSFAAESRDADRDLADLVGGRRAVRLRWRQVFGMPCRTAASLTALMGVPGRPCGPTCPVGSS